MEKKRRGKKKTSGLAYLHEEPYRTIIDIIFRLGESEPQQIKCVLNNENEEKLYLNHIHRYFDNGKCVDTKLEYQKKTKEVRTHIQSRPDKPKYNPFTPANLRDYLNVLLKWQIVKRVERGKYKITDSFKKEFVRESNKEIVNGYTGAEITDRSREYGITLYGLRYLTDQLEESTEGLQYENDILNKLTNIRSQLWEITRVIQNAKDYLVNVFLSNELKTQPPAIKDFFRHDLIALLDFQHMFKVLDAMKGFDAIEDDFHVKEVKIVKDYLHLHPEEQNTIKELLTKCKEERIKLAYPFTLFYSDAKFSPTPLNLDAALKEGRYKAIMENNMLSFEEKTEHTGELHLTPSDLAKLDAIKEERESLTQEIQEKLKELGNKYDDNTPLGDIPEIREIIEKRLEKALKERKEIEKERKANLKLPM